MSLEKHGLPLLVGAESPPLKSYLMPRLIDFNMFLDTTMKDTTISIEEMKVNVANYRAVSSPTGWKLLFAVTQ